jgi:CBS domain containing-hemolysin-like protein
MDGSEAIDFSLYGWRLAATLFFVLVNGFFVAAEFSIVKVRLTQIQARADAGSSRAKTAHHVLTHLDRYLSACQLGITVASLILGWLAEPAIAELLLLGAAALDVGLDPADPWVHGVALALALTVVTTLHMTLGEQAPKIWAIHRAERTALGVAKPLFVFTQALRPLILLINAISNWILRLLGLSLEEIVDSAAHSAEELKRILTVSAGSGEITRRQLELAQNVLDIIELEVRHIMVPRVDVVFLSLQNAPEENLRIVRESGHSRFPLCAVGLDTVMGLVHAKEVLTASPDASAAPDLRALARSPVYVSDTQSVSRLIFQLQRSRSHCSVVVDEHGTCVGLAFLEDALEEIVGPIFDEFDEATQDVVRLGSGAIEMPGSLSLPEAAGVLDLGDLEDESDTIGGYVVARIGRLPRKGDRLEVGGWVVTVASVLRRRIERLRFDPMAQAGRAERR